eukprot:10102761-Karenia_brevis.AAC.1
MVSSVGGRRSAGKGCRVNDNPGAQALEETKRQTPPNCPAGGLIQMGFRCSTGRPTRHTRGRG